MFFFLEPSAWTRVLRKLPNNKICQTFHPVRNGQSLSIRFYFDIRPFVLSWLKARGLIGSCPASFIQVLLHQKSTGFLILGIVYHSIFSSLYANGLWAFIGSQKAWLWLSLELIPLVNSFRSILWVCLLCLWYTLVCLNDLICTVQN